ncbi:enolase C-terminal domain-like protein [Flavobacterium sp.]|jgi:L-alanine-DL-glutamate epimerase-like enolase superfamily enzyme|uniref:enolase C-terminal domain-like protein n=1 Tax=Flavobacterium sp. TaxID=239 RepID=UPI002A82F0A6|nr:enolase C-terminal domain-like protein [Flavobacterium sp.]
MKLSFQIVRFKLKETFSISYGSYSHRDALVVSLSKNGSTGYGECTAIDYYGIDLEVFVLKLESIQVLIEKQSISHPIEFYTFLETLNLHSFLRSALDCAYWDLFGKLENKSFLELNSISYHKLPESSITISIDSLENQLEKIKKSDWNYFKVKCSHFNEKMIHEYLLTNKNIALDANCSFSIENCKFLEEQSFSEQVTYIEQPLKIDSYKILNANKYPNWMADEDCQDETSILKLNDHYSTLNLKLVKIGGLTPALQFIEKAKANDFKIMIGCMTESTIGISAGAVLTPFADYVDLDGANLISNDIATGNFIDKGKVILSEKAGLGISIK